MAKYRPQAFPGFRLTRRSRSTWRGRSNTVPAATVAEAAVQWRSVASLQLYIPWMLPVSPASRRQAAVCCRLNYQRFDGGNPSGGCSSHPGVISTPISPSAQIFTRRTQHAREQIQSLCVHHRHGHSHITIVDVQEHLVQLPLLLLLVFPYITISLSYPHSSSSGASATRSNIGSNVCIHMPSPYSKSLLKIYRAASSDGCC